MNFEQHLEQLKKHYSVLEVVELDHWHTMSYNQAQVWLEDLCARLHRDEYENDQRIVFVQRQGDIYVKNNNIGLIVRNLQVLVNEQDISNFFIILLSNNPNLMEELKFIKSMSADPVPITGIYCDEGVSQAQVLDLHPGSRKETYQYGSANPIKISVNQLNEKEQFLLTKSKVFCIYPWTHLHAWPTGQAFPCCMSEPEGQVGDCKTQTLKQIWNGDGMRQLRVNMLNESTSVACTRCYEQEESGFFSGRQSANKHHGHHIGRIFETGQTGQFDRFEMTYWDIRYSNLCNLRCRSCGHIFSSQWYQDQSTLAGPEWATKNKVLNYAGKHKTDIWEQLVDHLPYVEQIYFAGGEPLLMEEHYNILDELDRLGRYDVKLVYNTNFTEVRLKDRWVFDYWKRFESVAVGASLDAMGPRAEYIRKGTDWDTVERNRVRMLEICPEVDFYISPTLSILNAYHLPDFHRDWVNKGYIGAQDLNVNILQDPSYYRIDIAPIAYKQLLCQRFEDHLSWLRPQDPLQRATVGFESAIKFLDGTDNSALLDKFWAKTKELDTIREENILDTIPEIRNLLP
jgi:hypothetical protein